MSLNQTPSSEATQGQPSSFKRDKEDFTYRDYYRWMNDQLTMRISSLVIALLGNPTYKRPTEWRYGDKKHLVVHIAGHWQGRFHDFETGKSGDALKLVEIKTGCTGKALSEWVKAFIGYVPQHPQKETHEWKPITPVPQGESIHNLDADLTRGLAKRDMEETARYCYRDLEGNILGYVVRFEGAEDKLTLPLTYCRNELGEESWRWKGFPMPRMPYGAEVLKNSVKPILIVEGEKTAEAAKKIFPGLTVLSWVGGAGSVHLTEWSVLMRREVILWPDNDKPGLKCMAKLKSILDAAGVDLVRVVQLPAGTPKGWDLADDLPEGWNMAYLHNLIEGSI